MYADRIKQIRQKLDLSVAKLSKKIDIPERTITGYERGERTPSIEFLAQICKIVNVNPTWFLFGEGSMFNEESTYEFEAIKDKLLHEVRKMLKDEGVMK